MVGFAFQDQGFAGDRSALGAGGQHPGPGLVGHLEDGAVPAVFRRSVGERLWLRVLSCAEPHVAVCGGCVGFVVGDGVEHFPGVVVEGQAAAVVAGLDAGSVEGDGEYVAGFNSGRAGGGVVVVVGQCPPGQFVGGGGEVGEDDDLVAGVGAGGVDQGAMPRSVS